MMTDETARVNPADPGPTATAKATEPDHAAEVTAYYGPRIAAADLADLQALADLAHAQLELEEMAADPTFADLIVHPEGAAGAAVLREILALAKRRGVEPDPARIEECGLLIAGGTYLEWPPPADG